MNRIVWIAATAALALVLIGGGIVFLGNRSTPPGPAATPASTPPASRSATPSAQTSTAATPTALNVGGPVPTQLQARWLSSPRSSGTAGAGVLLAFDASSFHLSLVLDPSSIYDGGEAGSGAAGTLTLNSAICEANSVGPGDYSWTLSSSGRVLTLASTNDGCSSRVGDIAGTYWLMACKDPGTACLGDLDPGTYSSQFIRPTAPDPWTPLFGALTYTVPDGWANYADWSEWFGLTGSGYFADTSAQNPTPRAAIDVRVNATAINGACTASPSQKPDRVTAQGLLAGLGDNVTATAPKQISVDGHSGYYVDVDPTAHGSCSQGGGAYFFANGALQSVNAAERNRLIVLDMPDSRVLAIVIRAEAADFDTVVSNSMPVVQSMKFK